MSNAKVNRDLDLSQWRGVWVISEVRNGKVMNVSIELLSEGKRIAEKLGTTLTAVILGNEMTEEMKKIAHYGADNILFVKDDMFEVYTTDAYTKTIATLIEERKPEVVLIGATTIGRDLAPRIAARVGTGLTADCTALDVDEKDKKMLQTRPAFGGNLMATIVCPRDRPQMSTVRPGVMEKSPYVEIESPIETVQPSITQEDLITKVIEIVQEEKKGVPLTEARIIVSGGRGIGSQEGFEIIRKLAKALGGEVGSSRACVDRGWIEADRQVGQTGSTTRPILYIACGISGAIQHLAGMRESDYIIAINKDENAPIFEVADIGLVGDLHKVIPAILQRLEEEKLAN